MAGCACRGSARSQRNTSGMKAVERRAGWWTRACSWFSSVNDSARSEPPAGPSANSAWVHQCHCRSTTTEGKRKSPSGNHGQPAGFGAVQAGIGLESIDPGDFQPRGWCRKVIDHCSLPTTERTAGSAAMGRKPGAGRGGPECGHHAQAWQRCSRRRTGRARWSICRC